MPLSAPNISIAPDLARDYGLEQALMLAVATELVGASHGRVTVQEQRLYARALCLSRQRQAQLLAQLAALGLLQVQPVSPGMVTIELNLVNPIGANSPTSDAHSVVAQVTYGQVAPAAPKSAASVPSMGGCGGWGRNDGDELTRLFAAKEAQQQHLCQMDLEWQPSANIVKILLQQHQISEAFALGIKDEFVVYYMDKGRRETPGGWDQKFLKWVKKEQVQQQTAQARAQRQTQQQTQTSNEEVRFAAKERRRRITASVLDIKNTDW